MSLRLNSVAETPIVLVVDDDQGTRESARHLAHVNGFQLLEADTGASAIAQMRRHPYDVQLALVDYQLPDMSGIDLVRRLNAERIRFPWILMSGWMTIQLSVEATKLGAINALALPFDMSSVIESSLRDIKRGADRWPNPPLSSRLDAPRSIGDKWASLVLRACDCEYDLNTIGAWAEFGAMSYRSLTETCRLIDLTPHASRDFMRMLRVLLRRRGDSSAIAFELLVNDQRTAIKLLRRAGFLSMRPTVTLSPAEFIAQQRFVDPHHDVVTLLLETLHALA